MEDHTSNGHSTIVEDEVIWKPLSGYNGKYEVSNTGFLKRVTNSPTGGYKSGYIYATKVLPNGYVMARIFRDGKTEHFMMHRLVAFSFLGDPPTEKHEVNHINGIRDDNRAENLLHTTRVLKTGNPPRGEKGGNSKLTERDVIEIRDMRKKGLKQKEIADIKGISSKQVSVICSGKQWGHI